MKLNKLIIILLFGLTPSAMAKELPLAFELSNGLGRSPETCPFSGRFTFKRASTELRPMVKVTSPKSGLKLKLAPQDPALTIHFDCFPSSTAFPRWIQRNYGYALRLAR